MNLYEPPTCVTPLNSFLQKFSGGSRFISAVVICVYVILCHSYCVLGPGYIELLASGVGMYPLLLLSAGDSVWAPGPYY